VPSLYKVFPSLWPGRACLVLHRSRTGATYSNELWAQANHFAAATPLPHPPPLRYAPMKRVGAVMGSFGQEVAG